MRKSFLAIAVALFMGTVAFAQVGIKGGVALSTMTQQNTNISRSDVDNNSVIAPVIGLTFAANLGDVITLQPELLYSQSGGRNTYAVLGVNGESSYRINYLEVPVLAKLMLGNSGKEGGMGFYIGAGPFVGFALNGKSSTQVGNTAAVETNYTFNDQDNAKRLNYGMVAATGVNFGRMNVDLRYNYGMNNLLDNDAINTNENKPMLQTRGIALTLGYNF